MKLMKHSVALFSQSVLNTNILTFPQRRIAITGANGKIGYQLAHRIAGGEMLDGPVNLSLIGSAASFKQLQGIAMELKDSASPFLKGVIVTEDQDEGFRNADFAILLGSYQKTPTMDEEAYLKENSKLFQSIALSITENSKENIKVLVASHPQNTNCLALLKGIKDIRKHNFTSIALSDHNRSLSLLSEKLKVPFSNITNFGLIGNQGLNLIPCFSKTLISGQRLTDLVNQSWLNQEFTENVQKRSEEKSRSISSPALTTTAIIQHMKIWEKGSNQDLTSMGVLSDGSYGVPEGIVCSFPVIVEGGKYKIAQGLDFDEPQKTVLQRGVQELLIERNSI